MSLIMFLFSLVDPSCRANHDVLDISIEMTANCILDFGLQFFECLGLREYGMSKGACFEATLR
jgi:hypothetical protein